MQKVLNENPQVLDRIGKLLIHVVVGMKGCGPAVTFLLDHDVPLEIDESAYNVLHEASWGGVCAIPSRPSSSRARRTQRASRC